MVLPPYEVYYSQRSQGITRQGKKNGLCTVPSDNLVQLTYRRKQLHKRERERALCVCTAAVQTWHCAVGVQGVQEMSITERGD